MFGEIQSDMKILEMTGEERPREKLLHKGARALSDGELLAILLRTGSGKENALDVARRMLAANNGSLDALSRMSCAGMSSFKGVGKAKAATVLAAVELGRRFMAIRPFVRKSIHSSRAAFDVLIPGMKGISREECRALFLNNANYVVGQELVTVGGLDSTVFDTRRIIKSALDNGASGIILAHNHPSGNPSPSKADIKNTQLLREAASSFGIALVDHIVVCDDCYFSFAEDKVSYLTE